MPLAYVLLLVLGLGMVVVGVLGMSLGDRKVGPLVGLCGAGIVGISVFYGW